MFSLVVAKYNNSPELLWRALTCLLRILIVFVLQTQLGKLHVPEWRK